MHGDLEFIAPYLAFRPRRSSDWVVIDPGTSRGRRLAASFGFTIPKEIAMSAQPTLDQVEDNLNDAERHLRVVENNIEQAGLLIAARKKGRQAYDHIRKAPRVAWDWTRETFHLDPAVEFVGSVLTWLRNQLSILAAHFGATGGAGLGLLAMSTTAGRNLLAFALKPVMWALQAGAGAWMWVENALWVEPEEGKDLGLISRARNWLSLKMAQIRWFFLGADDSPGVVQKTGGWFFRHVAPHLAMNSTTMVPARTAGFGMAGAKAVSGLALLPLSASALAIGQWVLGGLVATAFAANAWELTKRVWNRLTGNATEVQVEVKIKAVPEPGTPAAQADKVATKVTSVPTPAPPANGNRATRRAAKGRQPAAAKA